jgi:hypothetical protein
MTQAQSSEEKARLKKQWTDQAIQQALKSQWDEAAATNKNILNIFPTEPDAFNRLGKALSELGQYSEARQAYSQTLKYSPGNVIAQKNLDRLASLEEGSDGRTQGGKFEGIDPVLFIEETGKTGMTELINLSPARTLGKVAVGDKVSLVVSGHSLHVKTASGDKIGQIEPRLANRLINFMEGGNRYAAAVLNKEKGLIRLIIREEYQHPTMFGKVSFPSQGAGTGETIRAYIKESVLRYEREDDDDANEDEYYDGGDEEEMSEIDFEGSVEGEDS